MPTYDYRCVECGTTYEVFHKVREVEEDVVCTSCGSMKHQRLISAPRVSMGSAPDAPPCGDGSCCGGSCGLE